MSSLKDLVGNVAVVTTVLQFLSGVLVCKQYVVNRTTAESSPLPFLCGVLSCSLWFLYGLNKQDEKIMFVNTIGLILMVAYMLIFYTYTMKKSSLLKQIFFCAIFGLLVFGYITNEEDSERLLTMLGFSACSLTLLTVAAPLVKLFYVIKVKNTECLPFPMIVMSFFVSTLWLLYGIIAQDVFLSIPNTIGALLAVLQLSLFVMYPRKPGSPIIAKNMVA